MNRLFVASVVAVGTVGAGVASQQGQPFPGPGTGITQIAGTVNIGNSPAVTAAQSGEWRMAVTNTPTVAVAPPDFVRRGARYEITWVAGEKEEVVVAAVAPGGWASVGESGATRWVNLTAARSVRELR